MNAEKELLLALLVEKYTTKKQPNQEVKKTSVAKKKRQTKGAPHRWTDSEKQHLIERRNQGHSFRLIARVLGLRVSQVENMYYTLTARDKAEI